jgi:Fe-S cluster assembly scaffold protein SufB
MDRRAAKKPFNRRTVEELSWFKGEPAWMTDIRLDAWDRYERLPASEGLAGLNLETMEAFLEPPRTSVPSHQWPDDLPHTLNERGDEEGLIIQRDATVLSRAVTKDSVKRGIVFSDIDTALKTHPDLVQRYFAKQVHPDDQLTALHTAFWSGGSFLYVPEFIELHLPYHVCYWLSTPGAAVFPHTIIVVERGSKVYFMDEYLSATSDRPSLSSAVIEVQIAEKAEVNYLHLQNWGAHVRHMRRQSSNVLPGGLLQNWSASLGPYADRVSLTLETMDGGSRSAETASAGALDERLCGQFVRQGCTPEEARYRVASGFFDPLLQHLPNDPLREKVRHYLVGKVTGERPEVTLHRTAELHPENRV